MKHLKLFFMLICLLFSTAWQAISAQDANFNVYLFIGGSPLKGSVNMEQSDFINNSNIKVIWANSGSLFEWQGANAALNNANNALTPINSFVETMQKNLPSTAEIGVACLVADGLTMKMLNKDAANMSEFRGNAHSTLFALINKIKRDGVVKGVVLVPDASDEITPEWFEQTSKLYEEILAALNFKQRDCPLIVSLLPQSNENKKAIANNDMLKHVNEIIASGFYAATNTCEASNNDKCFSLEGTRNAGKKLALGMLQGTGFEIVAAKATTEITTSGGNEPVLTVNAEVDDNNNFLFEADSPLKCVEIKAIDGKVLKVIDINGESNKAVVNANDFNNIESFSIILHGMNGAKYELNAQ